MLVCFQVTLAPQCRGPPSSEDWGQQHSPRPQAPGWVSTESHREQPQRALWIKWRVCTWTSPQLALPERREFNRAQPSEHVPSHTPVSNLLLQICWPVSHARGRLCVFSNPYDGQTQTDRDLAKVGQARRVFGIKQKTKMQLKLLTRSDSLA